MLSFIRPVSWRNISRCVRIISSKQCNILHRCVPNVTRLMSSYSIIERGSLYSPDYRIYIRGPNGVVSPFHDIPLFMSTEDNILNMVVEIPRWTNAKMEISREDRLNPIKQDTKKGRLRFVDNCFPHHGYIWNYGALPQTWEDPHVVDKKTGCHGDNDPIDVCEIGSKVFHRGEVIQVKVLGIIGLIDAGETDWKVIAINVNDPLASNMNDIDDVDIHLPGLLQMTHNWLEIYKIPSGKHPNKFAYNGIPQKKKLAWEIIRQTHEHWKKLISGQTDGGTIRCDNTTLEESQYILKQESASALVDGNAPRGFPKPIPPEVDRWHYVSA